MSTSILDMIVEKLEERRLERYRKTATVRDMAHSGDPNTMMMLPDGSFIGTIEYYKRYSPKTYETWRRLCVNAGLDPDKFEAGDPQERSKYASLGMRKHGER